MLPLCDPQRNISLRILDAPALRPFLGLLRPGCLFDNPVRTSNAGQLDELLAAVSAWLEADMLPLLDQCRTLPDFLAYDLAEPRPAIAIEPQQSNLVLAHWAGAHDIERRFELLLQRCKHHNGTPFFLIQAHRAMLGSRGS